MLPLTQKNSWSTGFEIEQFKKFLPWHKMLETHTGSSLTLMLMQINHHQLYQAKYTVASKGTQNMLNRADIAELRF